MAAHRRHLIVNNRSLNRLFPFTNLSSSSLLTLFNRRRTNRMLMCSSSNQDLGKIWIHSPFEITPSSTPLNHPSISHCPLPIKNPRPPLENRVHSVYQSAASPDVALRQMCQSKLEFYKSQFSSRVSKQDADRRIRKRKLQSRSRQVGVTVYLPTIVTDNYKNKSNKKLHGICLHVHGGGWIWGDSHYQVAHRCLEMSEKLNVAVVSVEYTLASFTQKDNAQIFDPVDEVVTTIDWIETTGADELNTEHIYIASGESSGAHLLLLSMLKRRDRPEEVQPTQPSSLASTWKCLNLVYGFYDLSGTPSVRADGNDSSPICGNELLCMSDLYCSKLEEVNHDEQSKMIDRKDPTISPLYANLSNLPPALITVGTADPLLDDSLFLACRYCNYGNYVEAAIYDGGEHGLGHFGLQEDDEMGKRAREHTLAFMKRYVS